MKKIFYFILVLGLVFTACEPMEDIYNEIDAQGTPDPRNTIGNDEYTLTSDDYTALNLSSGRFNSEDAAKSMIPGFISSIPKYDYWLKNSTVLVNYNLFMGYPVSVKGYNLDQDDYTTSGSNLMGFQSYAKPEDFLPAILDAGISSPFDGKYAVAKYDQFTGSAYAVSPTVIIDENFNYGATAGDLTTVTSEWVGHSGSSPYVGYATSGLSMDSYPSSDIGGSITIGNPGGEDVNKSFPEITSGTLYFSALVNFSAVSSGDYFFHLMPRDPYPAPFSGRTGAKDNGSGKILFGIGATSSTLNYGTTAYDLNTTYLIVASFNLDTGVSNLHVLSSALSEEPSDPEATSVGSGGYALTNIAIRQDNSDGPTGTIDGVRVANTWSAIMSNEELDDEIIGEKVAKESYYMYSNGSWGAPAEKFYFISDADFDSMGEEEGQPGFKNTFGSSIPPSDYLAVFLNLKFPYASEGDELDVTYDYDSSSSGPQVRGDLFIFKDGKWSVFQSVQGASLQFGYDGTTWVPDNTIKYTLIRNTDYEYMASQLTSAEYAGLIGNLAKYGDFDYKWTDAQIHYALSLFLDHHDPNATEGQKYILTYVIFDNGENDYTTSFIKQNGAWVVNE